MRAETAKDTSGKWASSDSIRFAFGVRGWSLFPQAEVGSKLEVKVDVDRSLQDGPRALGSHMQGSNSTSRRTRSYCSLGDRTGTVVVKASTHEVDTG